MIIVEGRACPRIDDTPLEGLCIAPHTISDDCWSIDMYAVDPEVTRGDAHTCSAMDPIIGSVHVTATKEPIPSNDPPRKVTKSSESQAVFTQWSRNFSALMHTAQPEHPTFGQIWTTKFLNAHRTDVNEDCSSRIVVILDADRPSGGLSTDPTAASVVSAPISTEIEYRSDRDFVVDEEASPLGYSFMVEVWNEVAMLQSQLGRCVATFSAPIERRLGLLYRSYLGFDVDLAELSRHVGPPIVHRDDPRVAFQEREVDACEHLRRPLAAQIDDEASPDEAASGDDELSKSIWVSGSAIQSARKRSGLDLKQVRERMASYGCPVAVEVLFSLQRQESSEVGARIVQALARALGVRTAALEVTDVAREHEFFAQFLARPEAQAKVRRRARELGLSEDEATARIRRQLAAAAARQTRGHAVDSEWLRQLDTLLGTWKA